MVMFGMGHGILTVSFGYVTNMYFSAEVYGRAKGWISGPERIGTAFGPSLGGALFLAGTDLFFTAMVWTSVAGGLIFFTLLAVRPGNVRSV